MKRLLVLGGGFAGVWAALSAVAEARSVGAELSVTLVTDSPFLTLRPRLYLSSPDAQRSPLEPLLAPAGIHLRLGRVESIAPKRHEVELSDATRGQSTIPYDALVVALGSRVRRPPLPGLQEHAHDFDTYAGAKRFEDVLARYASQPSASSRDSFIVVGASFTGLEVATELRLRLQHELGENRAKNARIFLVDARHDASSVLGDALRPHLEAAIEMSEIETRFGRRVRAIEADRAVLDNGEQLDGVTIFAGGLEANPVVGTLGVSRDEHGRVFADAYLRVEGASHVYAAGDVAHAMVDQSHVALMSCQHAMPMGRAAGRNAARELLGATLEPYRQLSYVTCIDLGRAGAVFTAGWDRRVLLTGAKAKAVKRAINDGIRPPEGDISVLLKAARARDDGRLIDRLMAYAAAA